MAQTMPPRRCLTSDFIGSQSTVMPMTYSNLETLVNIKERFRNEMKCLKIPSKFVTFLTFRALISWGRSRLHEEINIYFDYLSKWVEAKALPTNDARVVCKFLKSLFARFGTPRAIINDHAFKTPIGCTPYKLVYGKACNLPIKLEHKAYWSLKHANFDLQTVGDHRKVQLNELNELRDQAYENSLI
nr:reverse transcriptase domain-containing protein [Tanacetum cinerariifolium]